MGRGRQSQHSTGVEMGLNSVGLWPETALSLRRGGELTVAMTRKRMLWVLPIAAVLLFLASSTAVAAAAQNSDSGGGHGIQGAVFTATNAPTGNVVLAYKIAQDGSFTPAEISARGDGRAPSLADSGSLGADSDHGWLLVVNAGSNTVSVFQVNSNLYYGFLLKLTDQVSSFGTLPVSITVSGSFVYVLNAGTSSIPGNIFGYRLAHDGQLTPLSVRANPSARVRRPRQRRFPSTPPATS